MCFCNIPVFMSREKKKIGKTWFIGQNLVTVVQKEVLERAEKKIFWIFMKLFSGNSQLYTPCKISIWTGQLVLQVPWVPYPILITICISEQAFLGSFGHRKPWLHSEKIKMNRNGNIICIGIIGTPACKLWLGAILQAEKESFVTWAFKTEVKCNIEKMANIDHWSAI